MRINELSKKYGVDRRTIDYWTNLGWIRFTKEKNGYRNYRKEGEEDIRKILVLRLAEVKDIETYLAMDKLPKDFLEQQVVPAIKEATTKALRQYANALAYAKKMWA